MFGGLAVAPPMGFVGENGAVAGVFDVLEAEAPDVAGEDFGDGVGLGVEGEGDLAFGGGFEAFGARGELDAANVADAGGLAGDGAGDVWVKQHQAAVSGGFAGEHDEAGGGFV